MAIQITVREAAEILAKKVAEFSMSWVPEEERVAKVIERLQKDRDHDLAEYQEALKSEVMIQDPEDPNAGSLPSARRKLALRNKQGETWGEEWQTTANNQRKHQLRAQMDAAATEIQRLQVEIPGLEAQLKMAQETTELRRKDFEKSESELKTFKAMAPLLVQQKEALEKRKQDRMEAMKAHKTGPSTDAGAMLDELQGDLDEAKAGERASALVEDEQVVEIDLDQVDAEEHAAAATDDLMSSWMGKK